MSTGKDETVPDGLDNTLRDQLVAAGRAVISAVPFVGGALGEILTAVIPGQRSDRIMTYLRALSRRMDEFDEEVRREIAASPGKIELIEEGGYQAARALSERRIEQIVCAVSEGLQSDEADIIRRTRLLRMLGELDDDAIAVLNAYGRNYGEVDHDAWDAIDVPDPVHMQSSQGEVDREALYDAGKSHLLRLGLLEKKFDLARDGSPSFDRYGGDFKHRTEISYLGRMFLREIGMPTAHDLEG